MPRWFGPGNPATAEKGLTKPQEYGYPRAGYDFCLLRIFNALMKAGVTAAGPAGAEGADAARGWRALRWPATPEHWPDSRPPTGFPGIRAKDSRSLVLRFNTPRLSTQELG